MLDTPASGVRLRVPSNHLMLELVGEHDVHLRVLERAFPDVRIVVRGNEILISGEPARAAKVKTVAEELLILVQEGESLDADRIIAACRSFESLDGAAIRHLMRMLRGGARRSAHP